MQVKINEDYMIPLKDGNSVSKGWTSATDFEPKGVTWHWTAGWDLSGCRNTIGGANPSNKGVSSAHYGIGRSYVEGIDRYVSLENRSWHAGKNQVLRWDGEKSNNNTKGARATIGIETVNIGYAREGVQSVVDWISAYSPNGKHNMIIQPWTNEQIAMMIQVGKEIIIRWPNIAWTDHHGHHDVCPGYKEDVAGFPFAEVLRGIYSDPNIPDIWSPFWEVKLRQKALKLLEYDLGTSGPNGDGVDGDWGRLADAALLRFQEDQKMVQNGYWTTFVCRKVSEALEAQGITL